MVARVAVVTMAAVLAAVALVQARRLDAQGLRFQAAGIPFAFAVAGVVSFVQTRSGWSAALTIAAAALAGIALTRAIRTK